MSTSTAMARALGLGLSAASSLVFLGAATMTTPAAVALPLGNYAMNIQGRYDFHTWLWWLTSCGDQCLQVSAVPQPNAKAFPYRGRAEYADGRYTLAVDDPYGLRCGNLYYGPTIPTHDVYSWDAATLAGTMLSTSDTGCDGAPGGVREYPFNLVRM